MNIITIKLNFMSKNEELELAKRWFDSIPKNVYKSYIDDDTLFIVIDEDDDFHIQVSSAEVSYRAELFCQIIDN